MLFDLRGRGRRRTVQVVYLGLALLFLLGFVGFGVGVGGGGGGIFNALTENNGSNSASFAAKVAAAQKRIKQHPTEAAAWAALVEAQLHQASEPATSPRWGKPNSTPRKGKALLAKLRQVVEHLPRAGTAPPGHRTGGADLRHLRRTGSQSASVRNAGVAGCGQRQPHRAPVLGACRVRIQSPQPEGGRRGGAQDRQPGPGRRTRESKEVPGRTPEEPAQPHARHDQQRRERNAGRDAGR